MNDFIFHNPDKVYFGKAQMEHLSEELLKFGRKVLLVYGGGSIKKNGLYDTFQSNGETRLCRRLNHRFKGADPV